MTFDTVNRVAVLVSTVLLAAGLVVSLSGPPAAAAGLLDAGLLMLMLTPLLRLATTLAGDVQRRDRVAALTTLAVVAILGVAWFVALRR
jgi:hypothetical protein